MDAPSAAAPRPRGWFRRNWLWFIPVLLLGVVLLGAGGALGYVRALKSAEPYQMALKLVVEDAKVKAAIGDPVGEAAWWLPPGGELLAQDGGGEAFYTFDVAGPNGLAHVRAQARMMEGKWSVTTLAVTIDKTGERIAVETSSTSQFDEAPRWKP